MKTPWGQIALMCLLTVWVPIFFGPVSLFLNGNPRWFFAALVCFFLGLAGSAIRIYVDLALWERKKKNLEETLRNRRNLAVGGGPVLRETLTYINKQYESSNNG